MSLFLTCYIPFAATYSHPSIRHLQPSLMLRSCKTGQRQGCGHTQTFLRFRCQLRERQANMKNPAAPKVRAEMFYDVSSWQQVTKTITWDSGANCQNQNKPFQICFFVAVIPVTCFSCNAMKWIITWSWKYSLCFSFSMSTIVWYFILESWTVYYIWTLHTPYAVCFTAILLSWQPSGHIYPERWFTIW